MNGEDLKVLEQKFKDFKEFQEEKWRTHDDQSNARWASLKDGLDKLPDNLIAKLPCRVHIKTLEWHGWMIKILWGVIIVCGVIKGAIWMLK